MYANWGPQIRTYWALIGAMPLKRGELPSLLMINPMLPGLKVVSQDGKTAGEKWKVVVGAVENQYQHEVKIGGGAPDPFIDLDGDGQIEMMAAITNEHGDNKTYLAIFGADNGARLFDAPDLMVLAAQDLDGDGRLEVFLKQADGVLRIANWNGKEFVDRWRGEGAEPLFAPAPPEQDLTRSAGAVVTLKNPQVLRLTEDDPAFLMSFGGEVYRCLLKPQGSLERVGGVVHLESEAEAEQARLRRQGIAWDGRTLVVTENGQEKARRSVPFETVYMAPPALAGTLGGETRVIVRDAGGTILSLSADGTQRRPLVGNVPAFSNVNHSTEYPRLCDVDGDGEAELLTSAIMPDGKAAVVAVGGDGMIGLRIDMPENAGLMSLGPSGKQGPGEGRWVAVRYYGVMGSSWGNNAWVVAYDGASGKELWRRDSFGKYGDRDVIFALHTPTSVLDFNGDGTDDFLAQSENFYNVVSGRDGQDLIPMDDFSDSVPGHWTAYSTPMLLDLNGDGNPKVFFSRAFALTIVTDIKGNPIWHYGLTRDTTARSRPGIGDLDGNGETEIVVSQQDGVLTAFGARPLDGKCPTCDPSQPLTERNHSGSVIWNYNLKPPVSDIATADLDGDGCDELLVGAGDGRLYALKQRGGACVVLWFVDLGRAVGSPILADLDGDGQAEIVVPTEDGRLHCLKGQQTAR
jgi:hypothetical protein